MTETTSSILRFAATANNAQIQRIADSVDSIYQNREGAPADSIREAVHTALEGICPPDTVQDLADAIIRGERPAIWQGSKLRTPA